MGGMDDGIYSSIEDDEVEIVRPLPKDNNKPEVTILTMFIARDKMFSKWLKNFKALKTQKNRTHVLWVCFVHGKKGQLFARKLKRAFFNLNGYHSKTLVINNSHKVQKGGDQGGDWQKRNQAITEGYNFCRDYTQNSKYVYLFEDDVLQPPNALTNLMPYLDNEHIGQVVGFLPYRPNGRNHAKPLAWNICEVTSVNGTIERSLDVSYMDVQHAGCEEIGAGTFGVTLIRGDLFRSVKMINEYMGLMGPDVTYGPLLKKRGYKSMIDWNTRCNQMCELKGRVEVYG